MKTIGIAAKTTSEPAVEYASRVAADLRKRGYEICLDFGTADKLNAGWHELDTGHYPMLSMPDELTALLTAQA